LTNTRFPDQVWAACGLEEVILDGNKLDAFPDQPPAFAPVIRILSLNRNKFRTAPEWIGQCPRLVQLSIQANEIKEVPRACALNALPHLRHVSFGQNQITSFPECFSIYQQEEEGEIGNRSESQQLFFPSLRRLNLSNNFIQGMPEGCTIDRPRER
tara:strand:- start:669 stop:1136 length:468 start_codon:yes stop_codon:yes gene_type:complete